MAIAKVEPLTTARSLRGPFDYRLPAAMEGLDVGSIVRVPFGRQRALGVVVALADHSELPPERLAEPLEALESGATPELVALGLWVAREYCSTPSRGLQLVLPPGIGPNRPGVRARTELRAEIAAAGEEALSAGGRLGARQRAALEALRAGEMSSRELDTAVGADRQVLRRLEQRGLIVTRSSTVRRRPGHPQVGTAAASAPQLLAEQSAAVDSIVAALDGEARGAAEAADPRGDGVGQDRGLPRRGRGGAGAGEGGDRPRPRDRPRARRRWPGSGPGSATGSRSCTRP